MRISVKRSGGFAGITEDVGVVETTQLDAGAKSQLEQMIHNIGFFELPATVGSGIGADPFKYEITVSEKDRQHTITYTEYESSETSQLRRLVDIIGSLK